MDSKGKAAQGVVGAGPSSGVGVGADSNANVDWRLQLQPDARQRIVEKMMDTLKRHLLVPLPEGSNELQKIAVRIEEEIYSAAPSQTDYLRKISLKMLSMETKPQPGLNARLPNQDQIHQAALMDSTAQTSHLRNWQEEIYQKLKYLKDAYFADLRDIHQKLSIKLSKLDGMVPPNARGAEQIEKFKQFKVVLERMMAVLSLGKHDLQIGLKDKLTLYEKQIVNILQNHRKVHQQQPQEVVRFDQRQFAPLQQSQPGLQSQQPPQQQQPQQIHNHPNQLRQQSNIGAMPQSNSLSMPIASQQGIQNMLQSDTTIERTRKCKICGDCVHKRRTN